jgi:hypothetical protein
MVLRGHAAEALDHETGMTEEEDAHKHQLKQAEQLLRDAGFTSDEDHCCPVKLADLAE